MFRYVARKEEASDRYALSLLLLSLIVLASCTGTPVAEVPTKTRALPTDPLLSAPTPIPPTATKTLISPAPTPTPVRPATTPTSEHPTAALSPAATVTPKLERVRIEISYQDIGSEEDERGRQPLDQEVRQAVLSDINNYLQDPENRANVPTKLAVYGIHLKGGQLDGQDWVFVESEDERYWFWYGGKLWPLQTLNGKTWGIADAKGTIGVLENDQWTYPNHEELGIAQIVAVMAVHPSTKATPASEAGEVSGDGFRWERYSPTDWSGHVGYYWERSALPNPKHPWNFKDGYRVYRIQFGRLESMAELGDGAYRCTLDAGDKGKMTVTFLNGQEYTTVYNWMYNEQTDPHMPGEVKSDSRLQRCMGYPWPVRADKGPMEEGDGTPVRNLDLSDQIGRVIGFGVKEDQRGTHAQGAWISDLACTLGGDWNSKSW